VSDADFAALVLRATNTAGETACIAAMLGVSRSSVDRWRRGLSLPHPAVRPRFARLLREIAP
jgi:hypothetical protein